MNTIKIFFTKSNLIDKILILFIFFICSRIIYLIPSFDGAMNLLPAKNLVLFGKYYSFYFEQYFYQGIQTRLTLQIPAAFFMWLGGINYPMALLPSAIYTFFFVLISWKLVVKLTPSQHNENIFIIPLFLLIPDFFHTGLRGWGEVITYFFIVLALLQWIKITELDENSNKKSPFIWMGVFIGLSIVTKTVALITIPAFIGGILYQTINNKKIEFKFLYSALLILTIIASYELWKLYLMGFDQYVKWWSSQGTAISSQAGISSKASTEGSRTSFYKFMNHLSITSSFLFVSTKIFLLYFVIPSCLTLLFYFKGFLKKKSTPIIVFIFLLIWGYFFWWMMITPTAKVDDYGKFRRLLPAFIMNTYLIAITVQILIELNKDKLRAYTIIASIAVCSILITGFIGVKNFEKTISMIKSSTPSEISQSFYKKLNALPEEAKVFSNAYRQSPQIALKYKHHFRNNLKYSFEELINGKEHYLILDDYLLSRKYLDPLLEVIDYEVVAENKENINNEMQLIKIKGVKNVLNPTRPNQLTNCIAPNTIKEYPNKYGFYSTNEFNWTTPRFGLSLSEGSYNYLFLNLYLHPKHIKKNPILNIKYNDFPLKEVKIQKGKNHFKIPINPSWNNLEGFNQVTGKLNNYIIKSSSFYGLVCNQACLKQIDETDNIVIQNMRINSSKKLLLRLKNVSENIAIYINDIEAIMRINSRNLACKLPESTLTADEYTLEIFDLDENTSQKFKLFMDVNNQIVQLVE